MGESTSQTGTPHACDLFRHKMIRNIIVLALVAIALAEVDEQTNFVENYVPDDSLESPVTEALLQVESVPPQTNFVENSVPDDSTGALDLVQVKTRFGKGKGKRRRRRQRIQDICYLSLLHTAAQLGMGHNSLSKCTSRGSVAPLICHICKHLLRGCAHRYRL